MYQYRHIVDDIYFVGASDRRQSRFENAFPIPYGMSYNSYLVLDEKTVLLDTVDKSVAKVFFENLSQLLGERKLDYVIVNHMEPDHAATLDELVLRYPEVTIVGNAKTFTFIKQFFDFPLQGRMLEVKEGNTLETGKHSFRFYMAAMVHWPEVMVTYEENLKMLFSADAFGTFGALSGNVFADEMNWDTEILDEARRYYTNIVGKYGVQVQALLNKVSGLEIDYLCPLHGPMWRVQKQIAWFIEKYSKWSTYTPEDNEVVIFYATIYGGTEEVAGFLATELANRKIKHIKMYDVAETEVSYLVAEAFRAKVLVFASSSYNGGLFAKMESLLLDLKAHNLQNRHIALIENGSWALSAAKVMNEIISGMKKNTLIGETIHIKSSMKKEQIESVCSLADAIEKTIEQL